MLIKKSWCILIIFLIFSNKAILSMEEEYSSRKRKRSSEETSPLSAGEKNFKLMPTEDLSVSPLLGLPPEIRAKIGSLVIKDTIKKCDSIRKWRDIAHTLEAPFQENIYRGNHTTEDSYNHVEYSRPCLIELSKKMSTFPPIYKELIKPVHHKNKKGIEALYYTCGSSLNSGIAPFILGSVSTPALPKALASLKAYTERFPDNTKKAVIYLIRWLNDELNEKYQKTERENEVELYLSLAQQELQLLHSDYTTDQEYQLVATLQEALNEKDYKKGSEALAKYRQKNPGIWNHEHNKIPFISIFDAQGFFYDKSKKLSHQPEIFLFIKKALLKIMQVDKNFTVPFLEEIIPSSPYIQKIRNLLSQPVCPLLKTQLTSIEKSKEISLDGIAAIDHKVDLLNTLMYNPMNFTRIIGNLSKENLPIKAKEYPYFVYNSVLSIMEISKKILNNPEAEQAIINYTKNIISAPTDEQAQGEIPAFTHYLATRNITNYRMLNQIGNITAHTLAARHSLKASNKPFNDFGKEADEYEKKSYNSTNYLKRVMLQKIFDCDLEYLKSNNDSDDEQENFFCEQMNDFFNASQ